MISLHTAKKLKAAGLAWSPALHDFFAIPDRELDEFVFVISNIQATIDRILQMQVVSFQGASEWALDSLVTDEAVWLPREDQLRDLLQTALLQAGVARFQLDNDLAGCSCRYSAGGTAERFRAENASEAYAAALLHLLEDDLRTAQG